MNRIPKINPKEADVLLQKYYEGETSNAEEKLIYNFLSQKRVPERFDADKAIFGFYAGKRQKPKAIHLPLMKWASIAAISFGLIFLAKGFYNEKQNDYTYINGEKYTDTQMIKEQALASLDNLSASCNEIETSTDNLQNKDLVESQLQLFCIE